MADVDAQPVSVAKIHLTLPGANDAPAVLVPSSELKAAAADTDTAPTMPQTLNARDAAQITVGEVADSLQTDVDTGISDIEANRRRQFYGYNEFDIGVKQSVIHKYIEQVRDH